MESGSGTNDFQLCQLSGSNISRLHHNGGYRGSLRRYQPRNKVGRCNYNHYDVGTYLKIFLTRYLYNLFINAVTMALSGQQLVVSLLM